MIGQTANGISPRSPAALRVVEAGNDPDAWDRYAASDPSSTFSHLAGWQQIMKDVLGHDPHYLAAVDESGAWRGILPLVSVRGVTGRSLISLPFLNDGGPLGDDDARRALVDHAVAEARRTNAGMLELRSRADVPGPVTSSNRKISVHLPLPSSVDELWKTTFRAKLRSQIRRPGKEGMTARSGPGELDTFYRVFARNMRDLGTPVLPKVFFERILAAFGDRVLFVSVYTRDGKAAAAACCLIWRDEIEVTWASSLRELNHLSPNMLLYSHMMELAVERGLTLFNFGRCTPGGATHRFKKQWGSFDVPLPWPYWSSGGAPNIASADRPVFRFATSVWRRLPLRVANLLGPTLARRLP